MRNLKRVLSLALACVMVIGMMVMTTGAADFDDAAEIKNTEAVEVMSTLGIINGMGDGSFNPTGTLTRGQAAKIIAYMLLGEDTAEKLVGSGAFTDTVGHWADPYVSYCSNLKIVAGYGDGKFGPDDTLTDLAFGKMVMVALGEDAAQFEGASWATVTGAAMIEMGLVKTATGAQITRDAACALALEGLKYSATPNTWQIVDGDDVIAEFDNLLDATLYNAILDDDYDIVETPASDCLLDEVHNTKLTKGTDAYGRAANVYTNDDWDNALTFVTAKAVATFTNATKANAVSALLKNYKLDGVKANNTYEVEDDVDVKVYTDTKTVADEEKTVIADADDDTDAPKTVAAGIAALTGDNKVVEVYADKDKNINKIVVVTTCAAVIDNNEKADEEKDQKAYVTIGEMTYETEEFVKGDVVLYTVADDEITSIEAAESFTGTLTSYTNKGKYTIDGDVYELSAGAISDADAITAMYGKDAVYYLGQNGKIVYVTDVKGAAVETDGYAIIVAAAAEEKSTGLIETTKSMKAQVQAVLSDGTRGIYDLAVEKNNDGNFVAEICGEDMEITEELDAEALTGIYTYTLDGSTITLVKQLAALEGEEEKNGTVAATGADITAETAAIEVDEETVILNSDTVFVLNATGDKDSVITKTGLTALEATEIETAAIVVDVTVGKNGNTNVAAVVFAPTVNFVPAEVEPETDDYVYVDGTYVVTKDTDKKAVYTTVGTKADGTTVELTKANVAEGIYLYNAKGEVDDAVVTETVKVGTIAGTTYKLGDNYMTINDKTEIVIIADGAKLERGATVIYVDANTDQVVDLIYVTKAAD